MLFKNRYGNASCELPKHLQDSVFSPDDLQQIVKLMANATDRYIFSDTNDEVLHDVVTKFPDIFVYANESRIALRSEWQQKGKKLPMAYFDFGYSKADMDQLCQAAKVFCTSKGSGYQDVRTD